MPSKSNFNFKTATNNIINNTNFKRLAYVENGSPMVLTNNLLKSYFLSNLVASRQISFSKLMKGVALNNETQIVTIPTLNDQIAWFITGVSQSDGSFILSVILNKEKTKIKNLNLKFSIEMTKESLPLLEKIKNHLACGSIRIRNDRNTVIFSVESLPELWHKVLPQFLNYPLTGAKNYSFYKFFQVLTIIYPLRGKSKDKLTLAKSLIAGWNMNSKEEIIEVLNFGASDPLETQGGGKGSANETIIQSDKPQSFKDTNLESSTTSEILEGGPHTKPNKFKRTKQNLTFLLNLIDPTFPNKIHKIEKLIDFSSINN